MGQRSRDGFFRRLGRALTGVNAIEHGRPVPLTDLEQPPGPTPTLITDEPPPPPDLTRRRVDER